MKNLNKALILVLFILTMSACGEQLLSLKSIQALDNVSSNGPLKYERPYCEVQTADYELDTHVLSFQMVDKFGVNFGFDILKGIFKAFGLNLQAEKGQMDMIMDLAEPINPRAPLANVQSGAKLRKFQFDANIDLIKAGGNINYYYSTPLSELTKKAINNTLSELVDQLKNVQSDWSTTVLVRSTERDLIVPVGSVAGLRKGDTFKIYNVENVWMGAPCASQFVMSRKTTEEPLALAKVIDIRPHAAALKIYQGRGSDIEQGARVEIHELTKSNIEKRQSLQRSLRFRQITSEKLQIEDRSEIDVVRYVKEELKSSVREFGFYIKE